MHTIFKSAFKTLIPATQQISFGTFWVVKSKWKILVKSEKHNVGKWLLWLISIFHNKNGFLKKHFKQEKGINTPAYLFLQTTFLRQEEQINYWNSFPYWLAFVQKRRQGVNGKYVVIIIIRQHEWCLLFCQDFSIFSSLNSSKKGGTEVYSRNDDEGSMTSN